MSVVKPLGILAALAALSGLTPAAAAAQSAAAPTFTKDVAPIFQNKCEACHRPELGRPGSADYPARLPRRARRSE